MHQPSSPSASYYQTARTDALDDSFGNQDSVHLTRYDYIASQNSQNVLIKNELSALHESIDEGKAHSLRIENELHIVREDLQALKNDLRDFKVEVYDRFDVVDFKLEELSAESQRMRAYIRNSNLRNPYLRIRPIPILKPSAGILEPTRCPKNAAEFYNLRNPSTDRQRSLLAYLAEFYDVPRVQAASDSESEDEDDYGVVSTFDYLEDLFGFNESNFIQFQERAQRFREQPQQPPIKRSAPQVLYNDRAKPSSIGRYDQLGPLATLPTTLPTLPAEKPEKTHSSSPEFDPTPIGWKSDSTTQRARANLRARVVPEPKDEQLTEGRSKGEESKEEHTVEKASSDSQSPTNPNSARRGPYSIITSERSETS